MRQTTDVQRHVTDSSEFGSHAPPWWYRSDGGPLTLAADGVRVLVAGLWLWTAWRGPWSAAALWALVALGVTLFRARDLSPVLDLVGSLTLVAAAWAAVSDAYARVAHLDLAVHLVSGAVLAGLAVRLLSPNRPMRVAGVVQHAVVALALGYIWELLEWAGHTFVDGRIHIAYPDTMTDLAATALGGACAGLFVAFGPAARERGA